jgi:acyl carrier protein
MERVNTSQTITDDIRAILREHARLAVDVASLTDQSNLYEAGLTSHASVTLMLALEERFDVEFPERMLRRGAFANLATIRAGIAELVGAQA